MQKLLEALSGRASIPIIIAGALVLLIGAANGIVTHSFSLIFPDSMGRYLALAIGAGLIIFGVYLEALERRTRGSTASQTARTSRAFSDNTIMELHEPTKVVFPKEIRVDSVFLRWPECSILLWVDVPPKGERLRHTTGDHSRYLLSHQRGGWNKENLQWGNMFSLRYSHGGQWQVVISNTEAEGLILRLGNSDPLSSGWHHFHISWDVRKQELVAWIDGGTVARVLAKSFQGNWPENFAPTVAVGAFSMTDNDYRDYYCDTVLYKLVITPEALAPNHALVTEHRRMTPHMISGLQS